MGKELDLLGGLDESETDLVVVSMIKKRRVPNVEPCRNEKSIQKELDWGERGKLCVLERLRA